jgi:hypothetical protein
MEAETTRPRRYICIGDREVVIYLKYLFSSRWLRSEPGIISPINRKQQVNIAINQKFYCIIYKYQGLGTSGLSFSIFLTVLTNGPDN